VASFSRCLLYFFTIKPVYHGFLMGGSPLGIMQKKMFIWSLVGGLEHVL
jgi:hypothetical protein